MECNVIWKIVYTVCKRLEVAGLAHKGNDGATKKVVVILRNLFHYPLKIKEKPS